MLSVPDLLTTNYDLAKSRILSRKHRAWIALYTLDNSFQLRQDVLHLNNVTEADLIEFEESWLRLRCGMTEGVVI